MNKTILLPFLLFIHLVPTTFHETDIVQDLATFFKSGNSKEIAAHFSPTVELNILNEEEVYSKPQAEQIVRDFFTKHNPTGATVIHKIDTNPNYRFCILSLATRNGKFRISITLKKTNAEFFITEMSIEPDKL
jgi:hypothetical protein